MLTITYTAADTDLAARLQNDLRDSPVANTDRVAIVILSPQALNDREVTQAIVQALDKGLHILPVLAKPVTLPKLIDHLPALDFSERYDKAALLERVQMLASEEAGLPLRVRTPQVRASNRFYGLALIVIVVGMFVLSLLALGGGIIAFPNAEYATIDVEVTGTIQAYIDELLPRSTQDAIDFPKTLEAAPTRLEPLLRDAATAVATSSP
jgi:hypothetical protein